MKPVKQQIRFCSGPDKTRIAYTKTGSGPPLVKVATYMTHLEYDWNSPVWHHWLTDFSDHFSYIRYDQRGCGLSDRQIDDFSLNAWVNDLEAVVDSIGLERFALLGPSQGGAIAVAYAIRHPHRVSHLILYGAYSRGRLRRQLSAQEMEEARMLIDLMRVGWGKNTAAFRQVFSTLFMPDGSMEETNWFNDLQRISTSPENAAKIEQAVYNIDVSKMATKVSVPTLVLHSRDEVMIPFEEGRTLAAMIPGALFVPLESKNHLLLKNEPAWQQFIDVIVEFTRSEPPTTASKKFDIDAFDELTQREREVLNAMAQGLGNQQIAETLFISPKTVRNHITNIYSKLNVSTRARAIIKARDAGMGRNKS